MSTSTLSLDDIVNVTVTVGPVSQVRSNFNLGLIIGKSEIIEIGTRIKVYEKLDDMTADHWTGNEPEFIAAKIYFSQSPKPRKVAIGRWALDETAVQAVTACRQSNSEWYVATICGAEKSDIIAVAGYIESAKPDSAYFYNTSDSDVKAGTSGNVMEILKGKSIHRTLGQHSADENAIVAIMGYAMGANKQTSDSSYTLAYKKEIGIQTDPLTSIEVTVIKNLNGNVYINRGSVYNVFEEGTMADGTFFDELLNLDMLTNNLQTAVVNAFTSESKAPQTDPGMDKMLNYLTEPLEKAKKIGFIAPGVWKTAGVLSVKTGDTLPRGYIILADSIDEQPQEDREKRIAPPIYVLAKLAGAIHHASIGVYVNR